MNKVKLQKMIKEELSAVLENYGEVDPLDELERIATIMHQAADGLAELGAGDQVEKYAAGFSDLAERLRSALETHREQWGSDAN